VIAEYNRQSDRDQKLIKASPSGAGSISIIFLYVGDTDTTIVSVADGKQGHDSHICDITVMSIATLTIWT